MPGQSRVERAFEEAKSVAKNKKDKEKQAYEDFKAADKELDNVQRKKSSFRTGMFTARPMLSLCYGRILMTCPYFSQEGAREL